MHTASASLKNFFASSTMRSSRPSEPYSSMPSKHMSRFTGKSIPALAVSSDGYYTAILLMRINCIQPAQNRPLVVRGATAKHAALVVDGKLERVRRPPILLQRGLDVVVPVHQDRPL